MSQQEPFHHNNHYRKYYLTLRKRTQQAPSEDFHCHVSAYHRRIRKSIRCQSYFSSPIRRRPSTTRSPSTDIVSASIERKSETTRKSSGAATTSAVRVFFSTLQMISLFCTITPSASLTIKKNSVRGSGSTKLLTCCKRT